ncbi:Zn-dependent hydrolases, including glyoxylases [Ruminococcus sp. SR1/5]|mgnify:CR=1 FL=1|nr:Zn-dependent hydrolases, including glyoxylases [Ruminococcus sp. SR1/5]
MQLFRIIPLEKDLWAINEIDKTVMYVINGTERALLLDTGLGLTDLKEEVLKLCGEKSLIVVNTHAHVDHNSGNYQFEEVCVGRYDEPFSHQIVDQELREMSELMFFEIPEKEGFSFEMWNPGPARKICTVRDGDIFDLGDKNLKFWKFPVIPWGVLHCLRRRKDGFLQEISCSPGKCGDI